MARRTDNRIRLVTIPDGLPADVTAQLLLGASEVARLATNTAAEGSVHARDGNGFPTPGPSTRTTVARARERTTPIVEIKSDGLAVYAHRSIVTRTL